MNDRASPNPNSDHNADKEPTFARSRRALSVMRSGLKRYSRDFIKRVEQHHDDAEHRAEALRQGWRGACLDHAAVHAAWLGHCSVLLRLAGKTILTDPVLSQRIGMRVGPITIGPPRLIAPPVLAKDLPPVDLIVLSHAHFDHLDRPTLKALRDERTTVVTPKGVSKLVPRGFGAVHEVDWDHNAEVGPLRLSAVRPKHWGARTAWDRHRKFNSYIIEQNDAVADASRRILFAGDTALTDRYGTIGPIDLAIFGIGAYDPWIEAHANPEQVWHMFSSMPGRFLLPVHHSTFRLSDEPVDQPMQRLLAAAGEAHASVLPAEPGRVLRIV